MPRFVILTHDHPELHWDLMLEHGGALRTWRLAQPPSAPHERIAAVALPDHRPHYLDYEGPVGGGRGTVQRWDGGTYAIESADEAALQVRLHGKRVAGLARLVRQEGDAWLLEWRGDR